MTVDINSIILKETKVNMTFDDTLFDNLSPLESVQGATTTGLNENNRDLSPMEPVTGPGTPSGQPQVVPQSLVTGDSRPGRG